MCNLGYTWLLFYGTSFITTHAETMFFWWAVGKQKIYSSNCIKLMHFYHSVSSCIVFIKGSHG